MSAHRAFVAHWCDDKTLMQLARERGWHEESTDSLLDLVREDEADQARRFDSLAKAKDWARRNRMLDLWHQPSVYVYEWPNEREFSWERETAVCWRYRGDGMGWEKMQ